MAKTISLTEYNDGTVVPKTYHVFTDKIECLIEEDLGSTVVLSNERLAVLEPPNYILNKIKSNGDYDERIEI